MEKKIRYLMLLLCLCLFPIKAFALESELDNTNQETENKVIENISNNENLDNEDLVEIENPNTVLLDENDSNNIVGQIAPTEDSVEVPTTPAGTNQMRNVENLESEIDQGSTNEKTELLEIQLNNVETDLVGGENFLFSASSGELDKYSLVREEWIAAYENYRISTSDPEYNASQNEYYIESPLADSSYDYSAVIELKENYYFDEDTTSITAIINGESYIAWISEYDTETNIAHIYFSLQVIAKNADATIIDSIEIDNASTDIYVGDKPVYGASTKTSHFKVVGEYWVHYTEEFDGENYYYEYLTNASDSSLVYGDFFETFAEGKDYSYWIVVDADEGYRLNNHPSTNYSQIINAIVNGEEIVGEGYAWMQQNGIFRYEICILNKVPTAKPSNEGTDDSNVVEATPVEAYPTYYEEEQEEVATLLAAPEEKTTEDPKLEVKKDNKNAKKDNKKKKEEEKETNNNTGLIVFLCILVTIAIALPITIYQKKQ